MRRIIRRREVVEDDARYAGDRDPGGNRVVLGLAEFLAAVAHRGTDPRPDAVLLEPTDEVEQLAPWLAALALIVVHFPTAGDGRGFSQARMLRGRLRYLAELRARGVLKRDQLFLLARCGFDSFDLDPGEDLEAALPALDSFSVAYQDGSDELVHVRRREPS
jgi:uncharacterized protein (DUF934 family)